MDVCTLALKLKLSTIFRYQICRYLNNRLIGLICYHCFSLFFLSLKPLQKKSISKSLFQLIVDGTKCCVMKCLAHRRIVENSV